MERITVKGFWQAKKSGVSDIPCMIDLVHAYMPGSKDDLFQGITGRTAEGLRAA